MSSYPLTNKIFLWHLIFHPHSVPHFCFSRFHPSYLIGQIKRLKKCLRSLGGFLKSWNLQCFILFKKWLLPVGLHKKCAFWDKKKRQMWKQFYKTIKKHLLCGLWLLLFCCFVFYCVVNILKSFRIRLLFYVKWVSSQSQSNLKKFDRNLNSHTYQMLSLELKIRI